MTITFHVDRAASLAAGSVISLEQPPSLPYGGPDLVQDWPVMSKHGIQYAGSATFDGSVVAEWFFELVRRSEFRDRPSRFASAFGFATLGEARAFRHSYVGNNLVPILRVEAEIVHRANMNLIRWTAPAATTLARAREYWRSEQGLAPPLWELLLTSPVTVIEPVAETESS